MVEMLSHQGFRRNLSNYIYDIDNSFYFNDVMLIGTNVEGLFVIIDYNCNVIGVEKIDLESERINDLANRYVKLYETPIKDVPFENRFIMPFNNYTLKDFVELSNRINIDQVGDKTIAYFDDSSIDINDDNLLYMLSFIKLVGESIKDYFLLSFRLQSYGMYTASVYDYINKYINKIFDETYISCKKNIRPNPNNMFKDLTDEKKLLLNHVIILFMRESGFMESPVNHNEVLTTDKVDLNIYSDELLKLSQLSISDEKEKAKIFNFNK